MKLTNALLNNILAISAMALAVSTPVRAQRDYTLTEDRNVWLTGRNAAGLTTFADSSITKGTVFFDYSTVGGEASSFAEDKALAEPFLTDLSLGKQHNIFGADVKSYYRLSDKVVAYGNVAYKSFHGRMMNGSTFFKSPTYEQTLELRPFDISDDSLANAGSKHYELFNIVGAVGWQVTKGIAIGAKADFTAGSFAKYKDLRHRNTLMNLSSSIGATYTLQKINLGAAFLYRRNTETMQYDTYGTTEKVYSSLIDYANGMGEREAFGNDGFTDKSLEQPLFNEYCGASLQGELMPWGKENTGALYADFAYQHRSGYYGKLSQYTISHEQHHGDILNWNLRMTLPRQMAGNTLQWLHMTLSDELLTVERNNYRRVTGDSQNSAATHYDYYTPTKMSDKILRQGDVAYTAFIKPLTTSANDQRILRYRWHLCGGLQWIYSRQTAYIPLAETTETTVSKTYLMPHLTADRTFCFNNSKLLNLQLGMKWVTGNSDKGYITHIQCSYLFPIKKAPSIYPEISLKYDWAQSSAATDYHNISMAITLTIGK